MADGSGPAARRGLPLTGVVSGGVRSAANLTTADFTFQESNDGTTYTAVKNAAGATVTVSSLAASEYRRLAPADSIGVRYVKVVSSAAQSSGDTLYLVVGTV